ncbi:MAG TPA: ABC transporter permease [Gemmatimonadota bacterium]|nr:ABC transporter permease [Gemmatimonadota bacterium]
MSFLDYLAGHRAEVLQRLGEHLVLVGSSVGLGILVGVPVGIYLTRHRRYRGPVIGLVNVIQTIPSLALFGFLIPIPVLGGVGTRTAIVALFGYSLLPIIRNTYEGIRGIDPSVRDAGRAMGMTDAELLRQVELPLALGVILGGMRLAAVIGIGIATIAAAVGAGGLGVFIFRGLSMVDDRVILAGAVPAALLALAVDWGLGRLERRLSRWREEET